MFRLSMSETLDNKQISVYTCEPRWTFAGKAIDDIVTRGTVDTRLTGAFVYLHVTLAPSEATLAETPKLVLNFLQKKK